MSCSNNIFKILLDFCDISKKPMINDQFSNKKDEAVLAIMVVKEFKNTFSFLQNFIVTVVSSNVDALRI